MARPRAVLVGVLVPGRSEEELTSSLDELSRLVDTLGMVEVGRVTQRRGSLKEARVLGEGRLRDLAEWTGGPGFVQRGGGVDIDRGPARADVVVVDHELSPSQLRNLKSCCASEVLDRNGVIIEIFSGRAQTREARLQVELAHLTYLAPRLRELGGPSERQRGGIGGKGAGETSLELDRRKIRDRMAELRRELVRIDASRSTTRSRRHRARQVALVGYTNAGKSSLMRALTGAEPYVADQLFATLDTTVRRLHPEVKPALLITDTVGFIKDLPHSLVASFRSTLDAAMDAGLLLHVVDANDPSWPEQEQVTTAVLAELHDSDVPIPKVLVFNKCDQLSVAERTALQATHPDAWFTSAHDPEEVRHLHRRIVNHFIAADPEVELFVPWSRASATGLVHAQAHVLSEEFREDGILFRLRAPRAVTDRLQAAAKE